MSFIEVKPPEVFVGREMEMHQLERSHERHDYGRSPIMVSGSEGIGKTSLLAYFLGLRSKEEQTIRWDCKNNPDIEEVIAEFDYRLRRRDKRGWEREDTNVVLEDADELDERELDFAFHRFKNYKLVRSIFVTRRKGSELREHREIRLYSMSPREVSELFLKVANTNVPQIVLERVVARAEGNPKIATLLAGAMRVGGLAALDQMLGGPLYSLGELEPDQKIITLAKPQIILANDALLERLKKEPKNIFKLTPRKFEETIADLLCDMGMQVELTPQSHDDGRDILAYMDSPVGKFLTLVECKRYKEENKVGIELIKQLWATLNDHHANRGMMVTTSSFTKGASDFQKKYEWDLQLRDFSHIVEWIGKYKEPK